MIRKMMLYSVIIFLMIPTKVWATPLTANKTWTSGEILTHTDLNAEFTKNRTYIEVNRDMIRGDDSFGWGTAGHNHEGSGTGVHIDADALGDDDYGCFSITTHVAAMDANTILPAQMRNADHGDFTYATNSATIDTGAVTTAKILDDTVGYLDLSHVLIGSVNTQRATFTYADSNTIYISGGGIYQHSGSVNEIIKWAGLLTYTFTSLGASDWSYLYLDDSAIVTLGSNSIGAGQLIDSTTEPTWSATKRGWYNGHDKCIFAVLTDGSSNILEFFHDGDLVVFANYIEDHSAANRDAWYDVALSIPKFSRRALCTFILVGDGGSYAVWRTDDQIGATGHLIVYAGATVTAYGTSVVMADASQTIEIDTTIDDSDTIAVETNGWYFPDGV